MIFGVILGEFLSNGRVGTAILPLRDQIIIGYNDEHADISGETIHRGNLLFGESGQGQLQPNQRTDGTGGECRRLGSE